MNACVVAFNRFGEYYSIGCIVRFVVNEIVVVVVCVRAFWYDDRMILAKNIDAKRELLER